MGRWDHRTVYDSTEHDFKTALQSKDDQISELQRNLEAFSAQASHTQTRLLRTFDCLGALRLQHQVELSSELKVNAKLRHDLDRCRIHARAVEVERDELKDAVEELIQRVEFSNNLSDWPCNRICIPRHTGIVPDIAPNRHGEAQELDVQQTAYASSMITRLRMELDNERKAHKKTLEDANLRIDELEVQVAIRESELETYVQNSSHSQGHGIFPLDQSRKPQKSTNHISPAQKMSDEECFKILEKAEARNKSLEVEVLLLSQQLERAHTQRSSQDLQRASPTIKDELPGFSKPLDGGPQEKNEGASPCDIHSIVSEYSTEQLGSTPVSGPAPLLTSSESCTAISSLESRINKMGYQINAFKAEKAALVETAIRERRAKNQAESQPFQYILAVEKECIELSSQLCDLQRQLEDSRFTAKSREIQLLGEIEVLKKNVPPNQTSPHDCHSDHLDDDINVEESMELATPLQPTTILSAHSPLSEALPSDPLLIPLPFSPERVSSPPNPSKRLSQQRNTQLGPRQKQLDQIDADLEHARSQLAEKERQLDGLRHAMNELRHQESTGDQNS
ncbi:hypothetical protein BJ138DRAFT_32881 [Hygrophoropsis aurantiaca]|uniref:Uncharacterized protein n=1 Tax=Hygrophoropsis aurantiaca TaxID=72124 RepID=A0ACB8ADI0_9AGAM|nr:hypothetical protein BJ138DRAFT_32881 [Hygrophoropsis aurantiaca]